MSRFTDADSAASHVLLTTILVSYNTKHILDACLGALKAAEAQLGQPTQLIVVDNASRDGSADYIASRYPEALLIRSASNIGFGRANNLARAHVQGRFVLLLNTDAFIERHTLVSTIACLQSKPDWGLLGVRLIGRDGSLQPSCRYFPTAWNSFVQQLGLQRWFPATRMVDDMRWDHNTARACDWVPGCYYLLRAEVLDQVGLFDERFFLYMEEVDHCRRIKQAGWQVGYCPDTRVVHLGGESAAADATLSASGRQHTALQIESTLLYARKWGGVAGLAQWLGLQSLALVLRMGKALIERRGGTALSKARAELALWWQLARQTSWGLQPTR